MSPYAREVCQVGTSSKQPVDDLTQSSVRHVTVANAVREMTSRLTKSFNSLNCRKTRRLN